MMALSALTLANRDGLLGVDAFQHYQQALPVLQKSVQSDEEMLSDGAFLTHFLFLVYEASVFCSYLS